MVFGLFRAGPEGGAAPVLMLEYQKSHRRRAAFGPACAGSTWRFENQCIGCAAGGARGGRFLVLQHEPAPRTARRAAR